MTGFRTSPSALLLLGLLGVTFVACGHSADLASSGDQQTGNGVTAAGSTGSGVGGNAQVGGPPPPGPMKPGDGFGVTLAMSKLYLGDTDRDGTSDPNSGWTHFGFNIDGKISTKTSVDLCKPAAGGAAIDVYPDGDDGIDNSFGANILPLVLGFDASASDAINSAISGGQFTFMFRIEQLGASNEYNPLSTKVYRGAPLGMSPKFDGTDDWPVAYEDLSNGDITSPKIQFPQSYVTQNAWVSGPPSASMINLTISFGGYPFDIAISRAVLAMDLAADHQSATNGTISGVVNTEAFIAAFQKVAGAFSKGLCTDSTFANKLRAASDIMSDGTQDPTKTCDAISIGLGFDARAVTLGTVAPKAQPMPGPCGP